MSNDFDVASTSAPIEEGYLSAAASLSPCAQPTRSIGPAQDARLFYLAAKRTLDIVLSLAIGALLLPAILLVMLAIRLDTPGPCFFSQVRVGRDGRHFKMWKMRSMIVNAERRRHQLPVDKDRRNDVLFKLREDPRVTKVGRFLRKSSVDELPQLWNVLIGEMSLVGPRPALPEEVENYAPEHLDRLTVKPGMTCIWQVSGRSNVPYEGQVGMDLAYVRHQSLSLDVSLLLKTIPAVLSGKGAY